MKKYSKLCLVLTASLSLVLMFIYRHKYSNLNLMVQLMNAFQFQDSETKCNGRMLDFKSSIKTDFYNQEQIVGIPFWTEIFPAMYAYSSYGLFNRTQTLFLTKDLSMNAMWQIQCKLHYENKYIVQSKIEVISVNKKGKWHILFFECALPYGAQIPDSISFLDKNFTSISLPIIKQEFYAGHHTMCVKPLPPAFGDIYKLLEFIIYHSHIGVKLFIFYETGLSFNVKKLLIDVAIKNGLYILILPWNVPYEFQSELHFYHCVHRVIARNHSDFIWLMDLNNFIVLKKNTNLSELVTYFDSPATNVVKFYEKLFCAEYPSDIIAENLNIKFTTLLKTKASNVKKNTMRIGYNVQKLRKVKGSIDLQLLNIKVPKSKFVPEKTAVLHSYNACGVKSESEDKFSTEDKTMWQYKDIIFKSHIYILAKKANLTNGQL